MNQRPALIGGTETAMPDSIDVTNPYTGQVIAKVAKADTPDVDRACDIAAEALADGELFPAHRRAEVLDKAAQMIASESEEL
ncbi:MAG: aldehyde dehydrogenase family protein, partial [Acidimicrobiia bacterium]